jgi:hypothetical protein
MIPGFTQESPTCFRRVWDDGHGNQQVITIAKLAHGWAYKWERGTTYTIAERTGASSLTQVMEWLWDEIMQRSERYLELLRLQAAGVFRGEPGGAR